MLYSIRIINWAFQLTRRRRYKLIRKIYLFLLFSISAYFHNTRKWKINESNKTDDDLSIINNGQIWHFVWKILDYCLEKTAIFFTLLAREKKRKIFVRRPWETMILHFIDVEKQMNIYKCHICILIYRYFFRYGEGHLSPSLPLSAFPFSCSSHVLLVLPSHLVSYVLGNCCWPLPDSRGIFCRAPPQISSGP